MPGKNKTTHVFLGRFSPLHKGHQKIIDKMIKKYGVANCLILVGSTNSQNDRTPFKYALRKKMINVLYPNLKVLPVPDSTPNIRHFNDKGNMKWLNDIRAIESGLHTNFLFLGGSKKDLEILAQEFNTEVFVVREKEGGGISATDIRKKLFKGEKLSEKQIDKKILSLINKK